MASSTEALSTDARPIAGIRLAVGATGTRYKNRNDLTLIELPAGAQVHCTYTRNRFCAAPISIARAHGERAPPRYLVINAGNANAGTGRAGEARALEVCAAVAQASGCQIEQVLPFSTGVIGQQLNATALAATVPALIGKLDAQAWDAAAAAIMTTDTRPKLRSIALELDGETINVTGIAKGSGMIKPNMATMLAYVATDARVSAPVWQAVCARAAETSFNRITVDGDTSTNDALVLIASGQGNCAIIDRDDHPHFAPLMEAVHAVCLALAHDIVRDGEGATKFIAVTVHGGTSEQACLRVAYAVAESPLVKTALFASDPNWGRILAAVGRAGVEDLDITTVDLNIGGLEIVRGGEPAPDYSEAAAARIMREQNIDIAIRLGAHTTTATVWTCDFSYDYVKINAEYRS
jgi:glutamate N-acetyltransferase/amino-acid N-acetyltransferase